ncbi:MAG: trigger factor, partial [Alkaliphilus sp.]|nr:trigger factor [Alkaliphilus sp.]
IEKIVGNTQVEIPEIMIEHEIDVLLNDFNYQLQYQGLNLDTYFQYTNSKMEDLRSQMKNDAQNRIKTRLILESIANLEKIEVSDEEMDSELLKYATQYKAEVDEFKKSLSPEDFNRIKEGIKIRRTVDFLVENAKISA